MRVYALTVIGTHKRAPDWLRGCSFAGAGPYSIRNPFVAPTTPRSDLPTMGLAPAGPMASVPPGASTASALVPQPAVPHTSRDAPFAGQPTSLVRSSSPVALLGLYHHHQHHQRSQHQQALLLPYAVLHATPVDAPSRACTCLGSTVNVR